MTMTMAKFSSSAITFFFSASFSLPPSAKSFAPAPVSCRKTSGLIDLRHGRALSPRALPLTSSTSDDSRSRSESDAADPAPTSSALRRRSSAPPVPSTFLDRLGAEDDWKEWQSSFGRNGLTDFLPQFSAHVSCLAIDLAGGEPAAVGATDGASATDIARLPWQRGDEDVQASARITNANATILSDFGRETSLRSVDRYDCILDAGVLNAVVSSLPPAATWHARSAPAALADAVRLAAEASRAMREFGIYVAVTDDPIPDYARGYLDAMGDVVGLEWMYDLDGVSREGRWVSVARRYDAGAVNFGPGAGVDLLLP
ncbi:hypothetical protein ACHAWF_007558 [Thalassiosira exigua]